MGNLSSHPVGTLDIDHHMIELVHEDYKDGHWKAQTQSFLRKMGEDDLH